MTKAEGPSTQEIRVSKRLEKQSRGQSESFNPSFLLHDPMRVFWDRGQLRQLGQLVFANIIIPPGIFRKFTQRGKHFPFLLPQPMEDCWGQSQMQLSIAVGASPFCQRKIVLWWFLNYFSFRLVARQMAKFPHTCAMCSTTLPMTG